MPNTIPVLLKATATLKLIATGRTPATTKSLEQTLNVPHSTMYRILQSFIQEDWIRPSGNGQFEISYGMLPLLEPLVRHELLIETVRGPLHALSAQTGLTTKISVRQGDYAITIYRSESLRSTSVNVRVGSAFHLAVGSSGAVLLSALEPEQRDKIIAQAPKECWHYQRPADVLKRIAECKRTGTCVDPGAFQPTSFAVSAPVRNSHGNIVAAMSAIGFPKDFEGARLKIIRKQVHESACQCSAQLQNMITGSELVSA